MAKIQIGPSSFKKKIWKELLSKKFHSDVTLICDDGSILANRIILAAQSKFLKLMLMDEVEMSELILPGTKLKYVERVIKFMYSGKLTVTSEELYSNYLVWHVKELIKNVFRLDASLDLGSLNLEPPPPDWRDPDDPPPGGAGGGGVSGAGAGSSSPGSSQKPSGSDRDMGNNDHMDSNNFNPDEGGFRQHANTTIDPLEMSNDDQVNGSPNDQVYDDDDDIVELEVPRAPTPDIVDLINSDDDGCDYLDDYVGGATVVTENAEDDTEMQLGDHIHVAEAPKVLSRPTNAEVNDDSDYELETDVSKDKNSPSPKKSTSILKRRGKKRKSGNQCPKNADAKKTPAPVVDSPQRIFLPMKPTDIKTESPLPVAQVMPFQSSPNYQAVERPQIAPGMVVFRGKVVAKDQVPEKKPKPTALISGVRKYNPNTYTLSGLKKVESLVAIKEEKSIHQCEKCPAKFEVYKSLVVHIQRSHTAKKTACPECGKLLSGPGSIKKHLLTHRPEHEWPFECPLCHKKFQARADIPKHLKTAVHKDDDIPEIGTAEWFNLLYPEKQGDVGDMITKTAKLIKKEREKIPNLPAELGVTVDEYNEFNSNKHAADSQSEGGGGSAPKRRAADNGDKNWVGGAAAVAAPSTSTGRRSQRSAATVARGVLEALESDDLL